MKQERINNRDLIKTLPKNIKKPIVWPTDVTYSNEFKNLVEKLLDRNPETRLGTDEVLSHPWFPSQEV